MSVFTVILLTEAAKKIFEPARIYFAPFEEAGLIAFCEWNQSPEARRLSEAVPQLPEIIAGKANWRAVVVDHPRGDPGEDRISRRDQENPFDFLDNVSPELSLEDSKHALIRISHLFLGYPQMTVKAFEPYLRYEDDNGDEHYADVEEAWQICRRDFEESRSGKMALEFEGTELRKDEDDRVLNRAAMILQRRHNRVQRQFHQIEYSPDEVKRHQELTDRYRMREVRPDEVVFLSTRPSAEEDDKAVLKRAWRAEDDLLPSRFIERNDYPPMSRFAAYELLDEENSGYGQDLLRFWLSVLTLAMNQVPPSSLQAERLYHFGVEFSTDSLADMLNAHLSDMAMVRDHLDRLIQAPRRIPEMEVSELLEPAVAHVSFEDLGGADLAVSRNGYGLAADRPRDEHAHWTEQMHRVNSEAGLFMRRPRRAVTRSVYQARELARVTDEETVTLNDIDREELVDEMNRQMRSLVVPATNDLLDPKRIERAIDKGDRTVRSEITQRMRLRTILISAAVAFGIWVLAFVPYLVQAARTSLVSLGDGAIVFVSVLVCIGLVGVGTLMLMRQRLRRKIMWFNHGIGAEVSSVQEGASKFADYLSRFATFRRGADRLRGATRAQDRHRTRLRGLRQLRATIGEKIRQEKDIVIGLGAALNVQRTSRGLNEFNPEEAASMRQLFRFPTGDRNIPFNDSGDNVRAPYDFVTRLVVTRIGIYERRVEAAEPNPVEGE